VELLRKIFAVDFTAAIAAYLNKTVGRRPCEKPPGRVSALGTALYPMEENASDKTIEKMETIIRKLSTEAREQLFAELSKKSKT
jgi:hypothetical protein